MTYGDLAARVDFDMTRASPFSYVCNACKRCCRNKAIRVNPYEILRLAPAIDVTGTFKQRKFDLVREGTRAFAVRLAAQLDELGSAIVSTAVFGVPPNLSCFHIFLTK